MDSIFIYGPSGAGKTSAGKHLADRLDLDFIDLDAVIARVAGASVAEIFEKEGERVFRALETQMLGESIAAHPEAVFALGGGTLLAPDNRNLVERHGRVVVLTADPSTLLKRLLADKNPRPLLMGNPNASLQGYLESRQEHYDSFEFSVATDDLSRTGAAWEVQKALGIFRMRGMGEAHDVRLAGGGLCNLGSMMEQRGLGGPIAVVADSNTRPYGEQAIASVEEAGYRAHMVTFPAGESSKTPATVQELWGAFLDAGLERRSTVVAAGGGVASDIAGFAAATYMRGVRWVVVPTSLLAMVDAGLGGKTGIDLPQGKNLAGAFHPPSLVLADPDALGTLPVREMRAGLAEVIKAGVIGDPALFEALGGSGGRVISTRWIASAMAVKIGIIESDPYESGERAVLNFGHTLGHAVEHASGYELLHGEAVAIGMAGEAHMAERLGIAAAGVTRKIRECLSAVGLPVDVPETLDRERVLRAMRRDKKRAGGATRFALPLRIGAVSLVEIAEERYSKLLLS